MDKSHDATGELVPYGYYLLLLVFMNLTQFFHRTEWK
jgi:hypothetical protein